MIKHQAKAELDRIPGARESEKLQRSRDAAVSINCCTKHPLKPRLLALHAAQAAEGGRDV
jgi:hypothetical protein